MNTQLLWMVAIPFAWSVSASAATDSCGSAKIVSGKNCSDMVVEFDVSKCEKEGGPKTLTGKTECDGDKKAKVTAHSNHFRYRAKLEKAKDDWDEVSWAVVGDVRRKETVVAKAEGKKKERTEKETNRKIAAESPATTAPKTRDDKSGTAESGAAVAKPLVTAQAPTAAAAPGAIAFSGFLDLYYTYNFNHPQPTTNRATSSVENAQVAPQNNGFRYYDVYHNDIGLNLLEFSLKKTGQEVNFTADFDFGTTADYNAFLYGTSPGVVDTVSKHVGQAFISYNPKGSRWSFDAGKMVTHVGYEVYKSRDNFQYSRSVLYGYGLPLWHVGVRAGYALVPDKLVTSLYVYNGWNQIYEINSGKTFGFQAKYTPNSDWTIFYNTIAGPEKQGNTRDWRILQEANLTFAASQDLIFALEMLYGFENRSGLNDSAARWGGSTFHIKWNLTESAYLSPRFEYYRDGNGLTLSQTLGSTTNYRGVTLTHGYKVTEGLETRLEGRWETASNLLFPSRTGNRNSQLTTSAALLYSF